MTINYPDGTILKALLLSRENDTLRATVPGNDDVGTFTLVSGAWISDECEPVKIEFAWQRSEQAKIPSETECVCSQELASRLILVFRSATQWNGSIGNFPVIGAANSAAISGAASMELAL